MGGDHEWRIIINPLHGYHTKSIKKKRKTITETVDTTNDNNWPKFLIITSTEPKKPVTKINPFLLNKTLESIAGQVPQVKKLRSGDLLVECNRKQQAINLLSITTIGNIPVTVSAHRSLNTCQGIIRDRDQDLAELPVEEICQELSSQGVVEVKRFTSKRDGKVISLNTYLLKFNGTSLPSSIRVGPYSIRVDLFIPNPTRCFSCQKFGHGKTQCRNKLVCFRCTEEGHEGFDCTNTVKCCNCGGAHMASSKQCPIFLHEKEITTLKTKNNITYPEARRLVSARMNPSQTSFANVVKRVSVSAGTQTVLTWPIGEDKPKSISVPTFVKPISTISHSSCSTQTGEIKPPAQLNKQAEQNKQTEVNKSKPIENSQQANNTKQNDKQKSKPANGKKGKNNGKPSGPAERPSKATSNPIQTHNRFGSLEDVQPSTSGADVMDTSPAPRRSPSRSPDKGSRPRFKSKETSPIRTPP